MAVGVAVIRGFTAPKGAVLGNFWTDMTRSILYILLPLSVILGVVLFLQGGAHVTTLEGAQQIIPRDARQGWAIYAAMEVMLCWVSW